MMRFYVTFGDGHIFHGTHLVFDALDEEIVRVFMRKKVCCPWAFVYTTRPKGSRQLLKEPTELLYQSWRHV